MCDDCEGICEICRMGKERYFTLIEQVGGWIRDGLLKQVDGDDLDTVKVTTSPPDIVNHVFECQRCHQKFLLVADSYHGFAHWEPESGSQGWLWARDKNLR